MKTIAALVLTAALGSGLAHADTDGYLTAVPPAPINRTADRGATMKKHGIAASALGMLQLTVGMAAGLASIMPCKSKGADGADSCLGNLPAFASGATFTALGAISTSAGIPMWVYGAREERDAKLKLSASATGLQLTF